LKRSQASYRFKERGFFKVSDRNKWKERRQRSCPRHVARRREKPYKAESWDKG